MTMPEINQLSNRPPNDTLESFTEAITKMLRGFEARMIAAFRSYDNYPDGIITHSDDAL
jgi:hypothetical protein